MDTDILEEYAASISRVAVCSMRNWCGYIGRLKEGGHSDPWERMLIYPRKMK
jgi:hypothetical protein